MSWRTARGGLRDRDQHASWREVYHQLDVDPDQHEQPQEVVYGN